MPNLSALARQGWQSSLGTVLPAVTCSVQSTFLTGRMPAEHGIVGNGWYFRELGEVHLWRQHNGLVQGDKLWDGLKVANLCWWYAMGASTELLVTPRPVYHADGRKSPDCYTRPPSLHDDLTGRLGPFPLFHFWGPTASHHVDALDPPSRPSGSCVPNARTSRSSTCRTSTTSCSGMARSPRRPSPRRSWSTPKPRRCSPKPSPPERPSSC